MQVDSTYILCRKIFRSNEQGSKLPNENLLAKQYGVSRSSLREALKILKSKGVIKSKQRLGTVIDKYENINFFDKDILSWSQGTSYFKNSRKYFLQIRMMFEPEISFMCAKNINKKNKNEFEKIFDNLRQSVISKDYNNIILNDLAFHQKIIMNCGNPILFPLYEFINHILKANFTSNQQLQKNYFKGWEKKYLKQHEDLKNFIVNNNPIKAKNKMISIISENKKSSL
tara:strand:+ start:624 stop:1307 length:684 start_codon:yes stop_codon:yes gene_type:complete